MIDHVAINISKWLVKQDVIKIEEATLYEYAVQSMIMSVVPFFFRWL